MIRLLLLAVLLGWIVPSLLIYLHLQRGALAPDMAIMAPPEDMA